MHRKTHLNYIVCNFKAPTTQSSCQSNELLNCVLRQCSLYIRKDHWSHPFLHTPSSETRKDVVQFLSVKMLQLEYTLQRFGPRYVMHDV